MNARLTALIMAVVATAGSSSAFAQAGFGLDANGDGRITLAEMQAAREARMLRADADHDGRISKAEFTAAMQGRFGQRGASPEGLFSKMDLNGDGFITKEEIDQATARRFAAADTARQGYVTVSQLRQRAGGRAFSLSPPPAPPPSRP